MAKITAQILSSDSTYFVVGKDACRKIYTSKPNERWCWIFRDLLPKFPTPLNCRMALKSHNLFSIWLPVRLKRYVRQKFYLFQVVPFFFWVCLFPTIFYPFFQKWRVFEVQSAILGGKQTESKFCSTNEKFECFTSFFML